MSSERLDTIMPETETQPRYTVEVLALEGLGFGHGTISVTEQLKTGELTPEARDAAYEIIMNDPRVFLPVETIDDGCGDGRPTSKIFRLINSENGKSKELLNKSRRRAKVFGGGLVAASSMWRTISGNAHNGETVFGDRVFIADELGKRNIQFGGHTDNHAKGSSCGCGAIDKYPDITKNALLYEENIRRVLTALYGNDYDENEDAIDEAFGSYRSLAGNDVYFSNASGKKTEELMLDRGAVLKELSDSHLEDFIVINDVEGVSFDQPMLDALLKEKNINDTVQAFVIDTWRGRMYASAVAEIAKVKLGREDSEYVEKVAYADFLIRTLAVSGTLTAGDLPVLGHRSEAKFHYALAA
jgi:hypothetical protein